MLLTCKATGLFKGLSHGMTCDLACDYSDTEVIDVDQ